MGLLDGISDNEYYSSGDFGGYQFTSLKDIINQFLVVYVGSNKLIKKCSAVDVAFHAQRAMQELSFDTFKSIKAHEEIVPATLQMILPKDYVNYTKVSCVDSAGIKRLLYPTSKTSNPKKFQVDLDNQFLDSNNHVGLNDKNQSSKIDSGEMITNGNFFNGFNGWRLNEHGGSNLQYTTTSATGSAADPFSSQIGWFYENNKIVAYNLPTQTFTIKQDNVRFKSGEQYTVTYTLSGYSSGSINFVIVDENGHYTSGAGNGANGTFTQTVTAGANVPTILYPIQTIYFQNLSSTAGNVTIDNVSIVRVGDEETSTTWGRNKSSAQSENQNDYKDGTYWPMEGSRFGLDPQHAQANGSFYIDGTSGKIHFSSNISGKTVILDYISDGLGTNAEMQVHKFAEEAMYKCIVHAILSTSSYGQQLVPRLTKEKFAAIRKAKLRLSNVKLEELTQILRGKSKQIKH